jgi:methyl-accepting chemotaxis protein
VTDIVGEITGAAKDQSSGIAQVNKAVSEMDRLTQQNAASAEQSSASAEELSSQAEELAAMVATFQLERDQVRQNRAAMRGALQAHLEDELPPELASS